METYEPPFKPDYLLVVEAAERELREEYFRVAVQEEKKRLLSRRWWHRFFPWRITIHVTRR